MGKIKLVPYIPVAPVLLCASFLLSLYLGNIGELFLSELPFPLLMSVCFTLLMSWAFILLLHDRLKGELFASIAVVIFFAYGQIHTVTGDFHWKVFSDQLEGTSILFIVGLIALAVSLLKIIHLKRDMRSFIKPLRIIALIAVLIPLLGIGREEFSQINHDTQSSPMVVPTVSLSKLHGKILPDIYYIMPEDYSPPDILYSYFHFDNSELSKFLSDHGFYVATQSASNYPKSFLSITSSLNMEYLNYLSVHKHSGNQNIVDPLIENNNVMRFLKQLGYYYYQMGSWWQPTKFNRNADANFVLEQEGAYDNGEFTYAVLESSLISPFLDTLSPILQISDSNEDKRERIQYQFDTLPNVVKLPGPKFIFAHIISPHGPYVFDHTCQQMTPFQVSQKTEVENYLEQAGCINQKIEQVITAIQTTSKRPSVILLQTDEGAPFLNNELGPGDNWKTATNALLQEKFPILSAYYFPGKKVAFWPSISPVNSFRLLFNTYFGTHFRILRDKQYIFADTKNYYDFRDVTPIVQQGKRTGQGWGF